VEFQDAVAGPQSIDVAGQVGDFLVANKQGVASYQLAVNLDDHAQEVTDVVRGDDLLTSAARQILVRRALGMSDEIQYWHLPLVIGNDGLRLAKRHGDTRIAQYRQEGVAPERIIGLIASWSGRSQRQPMTLAEFLNWFDIERVSRQRVVFSEEDHLWLRES
jgi:glutamyl-tRNA synthetase